MDDDRVKEMRRQIDEEEWHSRRTSRESGWNRHEVTKATKGP